MTIGQRIGSYHILEKLGQGGMGEVYKAKDDRLKRMVAIKVLRNDRVTRGDGELRFLQEARAASALNHPNIVQIYELAVHDGNDYIVMEFVPGRSLLQVLSEKRLGIDEALEYASQIGSALAAAHAAHIVHRDIKPGNIIVSDSGVVKILDFGLAKLQHIIT
jgi:serine/threonine protein kinase